MQPEILIAAAGIIVTFIIATWRWSASQNKRFDQMMQGFQNEISKLRDENNQQFGKLRDENNQQFGKLRDENNRLRSEVRGEIKEVRGEIREVRNEIKEVRNEIKEVREDVHRLDNRIARQEGLIRALWAGTFKGDPTSEPAFPE